MSRAVGRCKVPRIDNGEPLLDIQFPDSLSGTVPMIGATAISTIEHSPPLNPGQEYDRPLARRGGLRLVAGPDGDWHPKEHAAALFITERAVEAMGHTLVRLFDDPNDAPLTIFNRTRDRIASTTDTAYSGADAEELNRMLRAQRDVSPNLAELRTSVERFRAALRSALPGSSIQQQLNEGLSVALQTLWAEIGTPSSSDEGVDTPTLERILAGLRKL